MKVLPNEFESPALLAEIREGENRWPEAITQWEQAARLRALEPTGLLKLAAAQIHERQLDATRTGTTVIPRTRTTQRGPCG